MPELKPFKKIDVAHLIRTGNIREIADLTFSEYVAASTLFWQETSQRMGQAYFNTLVVLRPDIAERIRGTENDAFYDDKLLTNMLTVVYREW